MISTLFHRWEQQLHDVSKTRRVVRPFEWGLDWIPPNGHGPSVPPDRILRHWIDEVMNDTDAFFMPAATRLIAGPHPERVLAAALAAMSGFR